MIFLSNCILIKKYLIFNFFFKKKVFILLNFKFKYFLFFKNIIFKKKKICFPLLKKNFYNLYEFYYKKK
ncbi:MAG: hypothetical protein ACH6QQ_00305 [Candidatus Carsonella ruddii]